MITEAGSKQAIMERRKFLTTAVVLTTIGFAGCYHEGDEDGDGDGGGDSYAIAPPDEGQP